MKKKFYSTSEALGKIKVSRNTLFLWFKHRKIPEVRRDRNNHRIFTSRDIQHILVYKNKLTVPGYVSRSGKAALAVSGAVGQPSANSGN